MGAGAERHYDSNYFEWQKAIGEFVAVANISRFNPFVKSTDRVVDFGCGGGYLLNALDCRERRGIEISSVARREAQRNGIICHANAQDLPDDWADVIVSNSALEHTEHPLGELRVLLTKVRPGGRVVFSVPHETLSWAYKPSDINQHLYTWSPMGAGNLFTVAGFVIDSVTPYKIMWPPKYREIHRALGLKGFLLFCKVYRLVRMVLSPIKAVTSHASITVVAHRPDHVNGPAPANVHVARS